MKNGNKTYLYAGFSSGKWMEGLEKTSDFAAHDSSFALAGIVFSFMEQRAVQDLLVPGEQD